MATRSGRGKPIESKMGAPFTASVRPGMNGLTRQQIMELNGISDPHIIQIGQQIIIVPPEPEEGDESSGTTFDEEGDVFEGDAPEDGGEPLLGIAFLESLHS